MVDQVEKELAHFSGFSPHDIQNLIDRIQKDPDWVNNHLYVRYKVHDGRLYVKDYSGNHNTLKYINAAFNRLTSSVALPDMKWIVSFQDYYHKPFIAVPVFALCKKVDDPYTLIIPNHEYLLGYESF